jgi:hypothetical protein
MYQLIRQKGPIVDRTFEIEFLDHGVQALDFTFWLGNSREVAKQTRPLYQKRARIRSFHAIGVSFERKADSPKRWVAYQISLYMRASGPCYELAKLANSTLLRIL